jgi:hypothetical protein
VYRKSSLMLICAALAACSGHASAETQTGHSVQWCNADVKVDGVDWKVYSGNFRNMYRNENANAEEWKKMLQQKFQIKHHIPHTCLEHVLDWSSGTAQPFASETAALAAAKKKRNDYRKFKKNGNPRYAGMIELDWLPSGTERMGAPTGEKRTPNPDLTAK